MFADLYDSPDESGDDVPKAPRMFLLRNKLDQYTNNDVIAHYRLPRQAIHELANRLKAHVKESTYPKRSTDFDVLQKLQIALFYYATGDHQKTVARACGVTQKSVSAIITEITDAMLMIAHEFVQFPSQNQFDSIKQGFYKVKDLKNTRNYLESQNAKNYWLYRWYFLAHPTTSIRTRLCLHMPEGVHGYKCFSRLRLQHAVFGVFPAIPGFLP